MSINDKLNVFSDNVALTVTAISDVIDTGDDVTLKGLGGPDAVYLVVQTGTAFTAGGAATLTIKLLSDSTANLATSPTTHYSTDALAVATLTANKRLLAIKLPLDAYERYVGVGYTVATGPMTAGTIKAFLTHDPQFWLAMGSNNPAAHN